MKPFPTLFSHTSYLDPANLEMQRIYEIILIRFSQ